jgi:hypothetical protein
MINNGFVHIHETAPWLDGDLHENDRFPNFERDDHFDPTAQFLAWFKRRPRANSCSSSMRMDTQELRRLSNWNQPRPIRPPLHGMARGTGKSAFFPTYNSGD